MRKRRKCNSFLKNLEFIISMDVITFVFSNLSHSSLQKPCNFQKHRLHFFTEPFILSYIASCSGWACSPPSNPHSGKSCCDVERENAMIKTQPLTDTHLFPALEPLDTSTIPTFTELLAEYNASISQSEGTW